MIDEEVLTGIRAFPETQREFKTEPLGLDLDGYRSVSWYGADLRPEEPAFCLVNSTSTDTALADLVGEIVILTRSDALDRVIYVYCLGATDLPTDLAVPRRAFIGLGLLVEEQVDCIVAVGA